MNIRTTAGFAATAPARPWPAPAAAQRSVATRLRRAVGAAIAIGGAVVLADQVLGAATLALASSASLRQGVGAALVAGLATGVGALPILFFRQIGANTQGRLYALAGGLMFGAALFGLLLPALGAAREIGQHGLFTVLAGALAGAALLAAIDRVLPHLHPQPAGDRGALARQSGWLMVVAIGLHNLPEGLAVGASYQGSVGSGSGGLGFTTALGIGIQNLPEGLIVALALTLAGSSRLLALVIATLTGLFEPLGALVGGAATGLGEHLLPGAMALAAGAMLFVVAHEVIPGARRLVSTQQVGLGLLGGTIAMAGLGAVAGG